MCLGFVQKRSSVSLVGVATNIFVVTKHTFCHNKSMLDFCRDKHIFVVTNICHDELTFVMTNTCFLCDKTRLLSWQKYACDDKHNSVATKKLSWQT